MDIESRGTQTTKSYLKKQEISTLQKEAVNRLTKREYDKEQNIVTIHSCEFEIFGIVQDVSFRRYTLRRAQKLGIRGWCKNTQNGTVKGVIQGHPSNFEAMRIWLKYTGSPTSRIDKCVFGQIEELNDFTYADFTIVKTIIA
ncbi:acylphosphatase-1 [Drosophila grimshawi]|uniref:acylphosphatase n=1 Tax=Drosophila grimshawi TaxID=7222 RepID=B4JUR5_DROGR|nr:acylphosphatase-1 [Drosophila grimshawi]EDV91235.1 GH15191 [Drosophila grimshawi]